MNLLELFVSGMLDLHGTDFLLLLNDGSGMALVASKEPVEV